MVARDTVEAACDNVAERRRQSACAKQRYALSPPLLCRNEHSCTDAYRACNSRANRALSAGTFPAPVLVLIEEDIATTLPSLHLFIPERGPLYQDLKDMLCAWVVARSDEGLGYVPGVAKIAAMILLNMAPQPGFIVMRNLLERHCLRSFYGGEACKDDVSDLLPHLFL